MASGAVGPGPGVPSPQAADGPCSDVCANSDILAGGKGKESVFNPVAGWESLC